MFFAETTVKVPLKDESLKSKRLSERFVLPSQPYCFDGEFLQIAKRRLSEMFKRNQSLYLL